MSGKSNIDSIGKKMAGLATCCLVLEQCSATASSLASVQFAKYTAPVIKVWITLTGFSVDIRMHAPFPGAGVDDGFFNCPTQCRKPTTAELSILRATGGGRRRSSLGVRTLATPMEQADVEEAVQVRTCLRMVFPCMVFAD